MTSTLTAASSTSCSPVLHSVLSGLDSRQQYLSCSRSTSRSKDDAKCLWLSERCHSVAQIALYGGPHLSHAFLATGPLPRLYTELHDSKNAGFARCKVILQDNKLIIAVVPTRGVDVSFAISLLQWWLRRCNLPVSIDLRHLKGDIAVAAAAHNNVVGLVAGTEISTLAIDATIIPQLENLVLSGAAFASITSNPATFSRLRKLRLRSFSIGDYKLLSQLPCLEELHIHGTMGRLDISQLESAKSIRELYVASNELLNICGLACCAQLKVLSVHSSSLKNISNFADAPKLSKVVIIGGAMSEIPDFGPASELETISLPWCKNLTTIAKLASCMHLRTIVACGSGLTSLDGLNECQSLESVDFSNCEFLLSLSPLSGAPRLRTITVSGSAVRNVNGLATCEALRELDVSWCSGLEDLSPLSRSPRLHTIKAACSGVRNINGLHLCKALEYVNFSHCDHIQSLSPLAGAAILRCIHAKGSGVRDVRGLELCTQLRVLDLTRCSSIKTVPPELTALMTQTST